MPTFQQDRRCDVKRDDHQNGRYGLKSASYYTQARRTRWVGTRQPPFITVCRRPTVAPPNGAATVTESEAAAVDSSSPPAINRCYANRFKRPAAIGTSVIRMPFAFLYQAIELKPFGFLFGFGGSINIGFGRSLVGHACIELSKLGP